MPKKDVTHGDALAAIHAEGGDSALKLAADLMEHNARSNATLLEQLYEGEKRAHEETKADLYDARRQLATIRQRLAWVLGEEHDPFRDPYDRGQ
jgi:hypothetical protein